MSKYKNERFDFSGMSERLTFQKMEHDGTFTDMRTMWGHVLKDGFIRSVTDNYFKIMVRDHKALDSLLDVGNRIKWKRRTLQIMSWQEPSYEDYGFIEILTKQIVTPTGSVPGPTDGDFFRDVVSVYSVNEISNNSYGIVSYSYEYDFNHPSHVGIRCQFSNDRGKFIEDKKFDIEHDTVAVTFNMDAPVKINDYIISPVHGRFKVDMIVTTENNMLEALCQKREVQ